MEKDTRNWVGKSKELKKDWLTKLQVRTSNGFTLPDPNDRGMLDVVFSHQCAGRHLRVCRVPVTGRFKDAKTGARRRKSPPALGKTFLFAVNFAAVPNGQQVKDTFHAVKVVDHPVIANP